MTNTLNAQQKYDVAINDANDTTWNYELTGQQIYDLVAIMRDGKDTTFTHVENGWDPEDDRTLAVLRTSHIVSLSIKELEREDDEEEEESDEHDVIKVKSGGKYLLKVE